MKLVVYNDEARKRCLKLNRLALVALGVIVIGPALGQIPVFPQLAGLVLLVMLLLSPYLMFLNISIGLLTRRSGRSSWPFIAGAVVALIAFPPVYYILLLFTRSLAGGLLESIAFRLFPY